jgi:hypothetical protein
MLAMIFTLPLIALTLAIGVFVPWLGLRFELMHRAERRLAAAKTRIIEQQETTIEAYRQLVQSDTSFSLAPSSPSPDRWIRMAMTTRRPQVCLTH